MLVTIDRNLTFFFEKLAFNHIQNCINTYNLLYQYQFGFRQQHSTHEITKTLDNGSMMVGVFLDLKKAFDTVNHSILFRKLYDMELVAICMHGLKAIYQIGFKIQQSRTRCQKKER